MQSSSKMSSVKCTLLKYKLILLNRFLKRQLSFSCLIFKTRKRSAYLHTSKVNLENQMKSCMLKRCVNSKHMYKCKASVLTYEIFQIHEYSFLWL